MVQFAYHHCQNLWVSIIFCICSTLFYWFRCLLVIVLIKKRCLLVIFGFFAAETPENDGSDLLLSNDFLKGCLEMFSVPSRGYDINSRTFPPKHLNIVDPLKENNNLGRSVSKGTSSFPLLWVGALWPLPILHSM